MSIYCAKVSYAVLKNKPPYLIHVVYFLAPFVIYAGRLTHIVLTAIVWWLTFYMLGLLFVSLPLPPLAAGLYLYALYRRGNTQGLCSALCLLVGWALSTFLFIQYFGIGPVYGRFWS